VIGNRGMQIATLDSNDKIVIKRVQLGRDFGDSVEVIAGLSPSDRIVDNPPETLTEGDRVHIAAETPRAASSASSSTPGRR
jgi:hypothetical protein